MDPITRDNLLLGIQNNFDQNEDMIIAILENLQLGRLDDCMTQYVKLQDNLMGISIELDNYPPGKIDLYQSIDSFNDELSHKDVLDHLKPVNERLLPVAPMPHACDECFHNNVSDETCRVSLNHTAPSHRLTSTERADFLKVAKVISARYEQQKTDAVQGKKRNYKRWHPNEVHSLMIAIRCCGKNLSKLSKAIGRNENQIRSFLNMNIGISKEMLQALSNGGTLPQPPLDYKPSDGLLCLLEEEKKVYLINSYPSASYGMSASYESDVLDDNDPHGEDNNWNPPDQGDSVYDNNRSNDHDRSVGINATDTIILPSLSSLPAVSIPITAPASLRDSIKESKPSRPNYHSIPLLAAEYQSRLAPQHNMLQHNIPQHNIAASYPLPLPQPPMMSNPRLPTSHYNQLYPPNMGMIGNHNMPWNHNPQLYQPINIVPPLKPQAMYHQQPSNKSIPSHEKAPAGLGKQIQPLQQVHEVKPYKTAKPKGQFQPASRAAVVDAMMGYKAISQNPHQSGYRIVPEPKSKSQATNQPNVLSYNHPMAMQSPHMAMYPQMPSTGLPSQYDPRYYHNMNPMPYNPMQYPYLSYPIPQLPTMQPPVQPPSMQPTMHQPAMQPSAYTSAIHHNNINSKEPIVRNPPANIPKPMARPASLPSAAREIAATSQPDHVHMTHHIPSTATAARAIQPPVVMSSQPVQPPSNPIVSSTKITTPATSINFADPVKPKKQTKSTPAPTITSNPKPISIPQKPANNAIDKVAEPVTAKQPKRKRKQPSAAKPAANKTPTKSTRDGDMSISDGLSCMSPLQEYSRISFSDDLYSNSIMNGHQQHSEDSYQQMLDSHGDVTLIAGLMNENSFM